MPPKKSSRKTPGTSYEIAKGDWLTPTQRDIAILRTWAKLVQEELDYEAIKATPDITYFNRPSAVPTVRSEYDQRFHFDASFDCRKAREDRQNFVLIRENIHREESDRIIPLISSQNYGHRHYDLNGRPVVSHKRTRVMDEVLRRRNINVKPTKRFPRELGYPSL